MSIIEVKNLVKTYKVIEKQDGLLGYFKNLINPKYKEFKAVKNINFNIDEGELVGYIGENGAGKSTTIKMLTGLLTPTSGEVLVNGLVPNQHRIENNKNIGAVFGQKTQLWWDLPVIESFRLIKKMYKIPENEYKENLKIFTEILELEDLLDVFVKENIRKFIKDINKERKTTVILTTHDLKDIEDVCDRIILLDKGQIIYDGEKQKFKDTYGKYVIANLIVNSKQDNISNIIKLNDFEILEETEDRLKIKFSHDKITIVKIMNEISKYCVIEDIHMKETELEDILKEIYRGVHNNDKNNDSTSKNAI